VHAERNQAKEQVWPDNFLHLGCAVHVLDRDGCNKVAACFLHDRKCFGLRKNCVIDHVVIALRLRVALGTNRQLSLSEVRDTHTRVRRQVRRHRGDVERGVVRELPCVPGRLLGELEAYERIAVLAGRVIREAAVVLSDGSEVACLDLQEENPVPLENALAHELLDLLRHRRI
jgi:hypothetical protein